MRVRAAIKQSVRRARDKHPRTDGQTGVDLYEKDLRRERKVCAKGDLKGADLRCAYGPLVDLSWSQLQRANLTDAFLHTANFEGADLGGARIYRVYFGGANLRGANLSRVDAHSPSYRPKPFPHPARSKTNFIFADLSCAEMEAANLRGAILERTCLDGAYLERTILCGASLKDASVIGAKLERAYYSDSTIFPSDDFDPEAAGMVKLEGAQE